MYASERLSFTCLGEASQGKAKAKTGIGKSDLPGLQGGPRKCDFVFSDKVRASRLYPDRNRLAGAGSKPPPAAVVKSHGRERGRKKPGNDQVRYQARRGLQRNHC